MAQGSIRHQHLSYNSSLYELASGLIADADPVNQQVGRKLMGCMQCNLQGINGRCENCPLAKAHASAMVQEQEVFALAA